MAGPASARGEREGIVDERPGADDADESHGLLRPAHAPRDDRPWIFPRGRSVAAIETPPYRGGDDSAGASHSRALPSAETTT